MGIPSYFSYIVKNHSNIIRKLSSNPIKVDNLYLDCNSIIYEAFYKMDTTTITEEVSNAIITKTIQIIKEYIDSLKPRERLMIAFDGVAPVAKQNNNVLEDLNHYIRILYLGQYIRQLHLILGILLLSLLELYL